KVSKLFRPDSEPISQQQQRQQTEPCDVFLERRCEETMLEEAGVLTLSVGNLTPSRQEDIVGREWGLDLCARGSAGQQRNDHEKCACSTHGILLQTSIRLLVFIFITGRMRY